MLLRDGATLIRGVEDVLEVLEALNQPLGSEPGVPETPPSEDPPSMSDETAAPLADRVLALLSPVPVAEDRLLQDLSAASPVSAGDLSAQLSELELSGRVARRAGGGIVLA
jgi:DNA processing protein